MKKSQITYNRLRLNAHEDVFIEGWKDMEETYHYPHRGVSTARIAVCGKVGDVR